MTDADLYDADRIQRLERATERLSQNVAGLSSSLAIVGEISHRQADLEYKSLLAEARSEEVAVVASGKASKQDLISERRRNLSKLYTVGIFVFAIIAVFSVGAANYANGYKKDVYRVCVSRNDQSVIVQRYLDGLPTTSLAQRHQLDLLRSAFPKVYCGNLK